MLAFDALGLNAVGMEGAGATGPGTPVPADATAPTLGGAITLSSITTTGAHVVWVAGADNVAVAGYEISRDTGTPSWADVGTATTTNLSGLTPATNYTVRVRAYDAAGNRSTAITAALKTATSTTPPPAGTIDASMVPEARVVVFEGSLRVVTFEG